MITAVKRPHVKLRWIKGEKTPREDGGYMIVYHAEECPWLQIVTIKYAVPRANGEGVWYSAIYIALYGDGDDRIFDKLCRAKFALEEWRQFIKEVNT